MSMAEFLTQTLGYPRIGADRELKKALEGHWKGKVAADELLETFRAVQKQSAEAQLAANIDRIGIGDGTLYDHVLDWAIRLGFIPDRFKTFEGLKLYFAMARGAAGLPALKLTKWYDTNYHFLVPEIEKDVHASANFEHFIEAISYAQSILGERAVPIVLGPVTFLSLAHLERPFDEVLDEIIPLYVDLLRRLAELGVTEVQLHEPRLVLDDAAELEPYYRNTYQELAEVGLPINLATYFDDLGETFSWVVDLPVAAVSLDFTRGDNLSLIEKHGWPRDKELCVGIVDGRNIWSVQPATVHETVKRVQEHAEIRVGCIELASIRALSRFARAASAGAAEGRAGFRRRETCRNCSDWEWRIRRARNRDQRARMVGLSQLRRGGAGRFGSKFSSSKPTRTNGNRHTPIDDPSR